MISHVDSASKLVRSMTCSQAPSVVLRPGLGSRRDKSWYRSTRFIYPKETMKLCLVDFSLYVCVGHTYKWLTTKTFRIVSFLSTLDRAMKLRAIGNQDIPSPKL